MFFRVFFGIFQRKKNLGQLDQLAAQLPGFTIADAVTKPFQEWDLPRPSRSITPPRTNCNEIVGGAQRLWVVWMGTGERFQGPLMDGWGCEDERDQWCVGKEIPRRMLLLIRFSSWKTSATSSF